MHRTQVYLDQELVSRLDELARRERTSKGQLLRVAARRLLEETEGVPDSILGVIALGRCEPGSASTDHDRILAETALHHRS